MVPYVLDASAILRYLDKEEGAQRVAEISKHCIAGRSRVLVSAIQWGEVGGIICKLQGEQFVFPVLARLTAFGWEVIPATAERAVRSGVIKAQLKIPYADAFAVDLAMDSSDHVMLTADFDVEPAQDRVRIEYLPLKSKPN